MTTNLNLFQTPTVADIFKDYADYLLAGGKKAELANTKTTLIRFTVPGWSNVYPSGTKSTADEMREGLAFLSQVTVEQFKDARSVQEVVFDHLQIDKSRRRKNRSPLNQLVKWAEMQGYFSSTNPEDNIAPEAGAPLSTRSAHGQKRQRARDSRLKPRPKAYALGTQPGDYINSALQEQLNELVADIGQRKRKTSIKSNLQPIKFLLGWLHREKGIPLDRLELESIIPFSPVKPKLNDFKRTKGKDKGAVDVKRYADAKFHLELEAEEGANQAVQRIKAHLDWRGAHPRTDSISIGAFINLAKFLYRYETETEKFDDIIVIKKLRALRTGYVKLANSTPQSVPHSQKSIPWEEALKVLRAVQQEADSRTRLSRGRPLHETNIARNIQRLLILLLFMASPPDRSRTIYELEVGKTFLFGQRKNGVFKPAARMSNPEEAEWYLHLLPADYKTGNTYGEVWDRFPDTPEGFLGNGKTLYYYIDLWLNQYRAVFKPTHKCLLTSIKVDKPLSSNSIYERLREAFFKHTGVPVTPKELRKMYVTYLKDSGATEAELEAAAARQRHSRKMQSENYDQQERGKKTAPVEEFHRRTMMAAFKDDK